MSWIVTSMTIAAAFGVPFGVASILTPQLLGSSVTLSKRTESGPGLIMPVRAFPSNSSTSVTS
jgi:hypothetical protein